MKYKYPRTPHLPWSPGASNDDKILDSTEHFFGREIIVSIKMDGENTTIGNNYVHARSLDSNNHPSRNWVKKFAALFQHSLPREFRICGENLYAQHSIPYSNLKSYFYAFSIWNKDICLSWDETVDWCEIFNIEVVPVIYRGIYDETLIKNLTLDLKGEEGHVVRLADSFYYDNFKYSVAKFVRENHVITDEHWTRKPIVKNLLK